MAMFGLSSMLSSYLHEIMPMKMTYFPIERLTAELCFILFYTIVVFLIWVTSCKPREIIIILIIIATYCILFNDLHNKTIKYNSKLDDIIGKITKDMNTYPLVPISPGSDILCRYIIFTSTFDIKQCDKEIIVGKALTIHGLFISLISTTYLHSTGFYHVEIQWSNVTNVLTRIRPTVY